MIRRVFRFMAADPTRRDNILISILISSLAVIVAFLYNTSIVDMDKEKSVFLFPSNKKEYENEKKIKCFQDEMKKLEGVMDDKTINKEEKKGIEKMLRFIDDENASYSLMEEQDFRKPLEKFDEKGYSWITKDTYKRAIRKFTDAFTETMRNNYYIIEKDIDQ